MQRPLPIEPYSWFFRLATFVLIVALLRLGRDVLMPITFAVLLAFLLAPTVVRLGRWGLPKALAIIVAVGLAFSVIGAIGWLVADQAIRLGRQLPSYEQNLHEKIALLKKPQTPGPLSELGTMFDKLGKELAAPSPTAPAPAGGAPSEPKPVPVEVRSTHQSPFAVAREVLSPVLSPLATAGIVVVFVVAMLFQREDLRDRFIQLVSAGRINAATQAVDDASRRVSRFLWMQLVVNATYGLPVGLVLHLIGVPNAVLWGVMAMLLRFIPYIGPWIAAAFPIALTLVIDPGWTKFFYTVGLFVAMELISNNIIEVVLYGASTGISNLAMLVSAVFWTWLWGVGGLVLATPLTVCVLVLGRHVPGLRGFSVLLGSEPVLEPPAQFYQRMLSMESEDMLDLAKKHIEEHSLEDFYEEVFVPALILAEEDRHSGALAEARQSFIFQAGRDLIEELERLDDSRQPAGEKGAAAGATMLPAPPQVIGLPARDAADELVALMLAHLLRLRQVSVAVIGLEGDFSAVSTCVKRYGVKLAFISALPPSALVSARQMSRRTRALDPQIQLIVGVWTRLAARGEIKDRLAMTQPTEVVTTLAEAVAEIARRAGRTAGEPAAPLVEAAAR